MKSRRFGSLILFFIFIFSIIINISSIKSKLICEPDFKSIGDDYNSLNDPQDHSEYLYGYEFAHRAGDGEYYDYWKGIYWDDENFCYKAYDINERPINNLDELGPYDRIESYPVINNLDDIPSSGSYIFINHTQSNLLNIHKQMCMTNNYHGNFELLIKMDKIFEDDYLNTPYDFYFTIENPFNYDATFVFKVRNFIYTSTSSSIPEEFYITNNYNIESHSSLKVKVSLTFEKNENITIGGYFVISEEKGKSTEPFYWPIVVNDNGKLKKLTNMEIILESSASIGLSTYSLMRRRDLEENSYLGKECHYDSNYKVINGGCGDGYYCDSTKCKSCTKSHCKDCESNGKCTKCFSISVEGQWNPIGGSGNNLNCDLDFIDITKVRTIDKYPIEVPPAIHWRVTMDFWI